MKKIYTLLGAMAFVSIGAFAQHQVTQQRMGKLVKAKKIPAHFNNKQTFPDTLGLNVFMGDGNTYGYGTLTNSSGYFCGTNWDSTGTPGNENGEFVGYYNIGDNYSVTDIIGFCFHKDYMAGGGTSKIVGSVQLFNDTTTLTTPPLSYPSPSPNPYTVGQSLVGDTGSITVASIDTTSGLFVIHLSTPAHILPTSGDWGVFVDWSDCYNNSDTIGLMLNSPPSGLSYTDTTKLLMWYNNGGLFWVPTYLALSTPFAAGIFAVVDDGLGINHYDAKGLKMYQNAPNPSNGNTTINYRLKNTGMAYFRVLSSTGKVVYQENGTKQAGVTNKVVFNQGQLAAGIYFYQLNANGETLTMKMVITK